MPRIKFELYSAELEELRKFLTGNLKFHAGLASGGSVNHIWPTGNIYPLCNQRLSKSRRMWMWTDGWCPICYEKVIKLSRHA